MKNTTALLEFWEEQMRHSHRSSNYFFRKSPSHYHMMLLVMAAHKQDIKLSVEELKTKRFVIRKSLIGKNVVISFTNKKQENVSYNHDEVYNTHSERFNSMNCFQKYKSYTNSNCVPSFCRNLQTITE